MSPDDDPRPTEDSSATAEYPRVTTVGIGASAGGVQALCELFDALPADTGAAFVVIVHLNPEIDSDLPAILARHTEMRVFQVGPTAELKPDCIYVIAPNRQLEITDHHVSATDFKEPRNQRAPIDSFFSSLAVQHGDGFAVILTGGGSDGATGIKAVKEAGGIILVQNPAETEHPSMPRSAIATGMADYVLPIRQIAERLSELIHSKQGLNSLKTATDREDSLRPILVHLRVRTGHDFTRYKRSTMKRRIMRRMQVSRTQTFEEYFSRLRHSDDEVQALLRELLISVTAFFRDDQPFRFLAQRVIPELFTIDRDQIRIWVAGCATGEEAYSLAMLLLEEASKHDVRPEIQIFATDLDTKALNIAREGRYHLAISEEVSEERLRRFFTSDGEHYRVKRELRDVVLFANHSLLKDPPFSRLDLISCRNVLIYFDRELQQQVLATLHYGLNSDGYLMLGTSEHADQADGLFRMVDRELRLYQSNGRTGERLPVPRPDGTTQLSPPTSSPPFRARSQHGAHKEALEAVAPPSILVDASGRVLNLSESVGKYLQPSAGPLTSDVSDLVHQQLKLELRNTLQRAISSHNSVLSSPIMMRLDGSQKRIFILIRPLLLKNEQDQEQERAVILFIEEKPELNEAVSSLANASTAETVEWLRMELELAQSRLQTTREDSDSTNEALRAANEELQSINEEYRSTAEELETSKEELQSINEELQTVNSELKLKLQSVSRANSDLQNLIAAMDFGTLFLDRNLRINRYTPLLAALFSITPGDIGRLITDFRHQLEYDDLTIDALAVLEQLTPIEKEIKSTNGNFYLVRLRPYRTTDDKIDGVVLTFVDITVRREMEEAVALGEEKLRQETRLVELSHAPIFIWDYESDEVCQWNKGSEELYGYSDQEAVGKPIQALLKITSPDLSFESLKETLLATGSWKGELHHETKSGQSLTVESQLELVNTGTSRLVLEATRDITASKEWEKNQQLLMQELTHRVKNTLAIIQSIIRQTWRKSKSPDMFIESLNGRMQALSHSHDLLVNSSWSGTDMEELVMSQTAAFVADIPERISIRGEPITLPSNISASFGLILHELATNAAKYGALSVDSGRIDLSWQLHSDGGGRVLNFVWEEHQGPAVQEPERHGFGSQLITSGLSGAKTNLEFLPDGVRCTIDVVLMENN